MFKKTSKSKKSTINRDTLLIVQIFVLILIILLIINQVDSFKNNKVSYTEGFVDNQTDTVILHINDDITGDNKKVRLGDLSNILIRDNGILTSNFNITTLSTYNLYKTEDNIKTSDFFKNNTITHISILDGYSAILYDGNNFDNNKRSILLDGNEKNDELDLNEYKFIKQLSSIKVFKTDDKYDVLKREANYNNQILLFSVNNESKNYKNKGEISRINLPIEKMKDINKIKYFYRIDSDNPIKSIYSIVIPGTEDIDDIADTYRNIELTLYKDNNKDNKIIEATIIGNEIYDDNTKLNNITHYKIIPRVPTLDTFTALNILNNNMVELDGLKSEFENIKNEQIETNDDIQIDQKNVVEQLTSSFINKIDSQNNNYNYKLYKYTH